MPDGLRAAPSSAGFSAPADLRTTLLERIVIADGAMGTMLQGYDLTLQDFHDLEGCNEILNVTRPDIVRAILPAASASSVIRSAMPYSPSADKLAPNELVSTASTPTAK